MKRLILTIALTLISLSLCTSIYAKTEETESTMINHLMTYDGTEGVEAVDLKGFMLNFAKPALKDTPMKNVTDNIRNIFVFSFSETRTEERKKFRNGIAPVLAEYEKVLEKKVDKKESTTYLKRKDDALISEMVVYSMDDKAIVLVVIRGDIPVSGIEDTPASE